MNINEIKAQEAREAERSNPVNTMERLTYFAEENTVCEGFDLKSDLKIILQDYKLQEQYVSKVQKDNDRLRKIINILCDTISQLI